MHIHGLLRGLVVLLLCFGSNTRAQGGSVSLDNVCAQFGTDTIMTEIQIIFNIRFTNNTSYFMTGFTNGFAISSPDGATWGSAVGELVESQGQTWFDGGVFLNSFGVNGAQADTLGIGGYKLFGSGLPSGYDDVFIKIVIGPIPNSSDGLHICLDSTWYPPGGSWNWSFSNSSSGPPSWSGPHCFTVYQIPCADDVDGDQVPDCIDNCPLVYNPSQIDANANCIGDVCEPLGLCCDMRGDCDHDGSWTVADLAYLVSYLFRAGPPMICPDEADINGDFQLNIADVTDFVAFLFGGSLPPPPCN